MSLTAKELWEKAGTNKHITREDLGIDTPRTNDGLQVLNEGFFGNKIPKQNKKSKAYKIVYDDLTQHNLFKGIYDAKNGKEYFMYGVATVMEYIAHGVSEECLEKFHKEFTQNLIASKEKT